MNNIPTFIAASPASYEPERKEGHYTHKSYPQIGKYLAQKFPHFSWDFHDFRQFKYRASEYEIDEFAKFIMPDNMKYFPDTYYVTYDASIILPGKMREREIAIVSNIVDTIHQIDKLRDPKKALYIGYGGIEFNVKLDQDTCDYIPQGKVYLCAYEANADDLVQHLIKKYEYLIKHHGG